LPTPVFFAPVDTHKKIAVTYFNNPAINFELWCLTSKNIPACRQAGSISSGTGQTEY